MPGFEKRAYVNISKLRTDTPNCDQRVHFNNAGAALSPRSVSQVVLDHLNLEAHLGGYEAELSAEAELAAVYRSLARLIGAREQEIAITQNATRAWDMVFYAIPLAPGDRIITCRSEYASNYIAFLQRSRQTGAEIVVLEDDPNGTIDLQHLASLLDDRVKVVAINHMPTNGGGLQPAAEIGKLTAFYPTALFLLDACQTVGQVPLSVADLQCDVLSATSRKFLRGPRGLGFLYVREPLITTLEPPFLDLHAATWTRPDHYEVRTDAKRFETYETFVAGRLGLGAAADYALKVGLDDAWVRIQQLAKGIRGLLSGMNRVRVLDRGRPLGGIVTFDAESKEPEEIALQLRADGVNVWTCSANSARLDMESRNLKRLVRVSPHYYNTENEIDRFIEALKKVLR